jgi:hypothetical protein
MALVMGLVLVLATGIAIGMLIARRTHSGAGYYSREHSDLPIIGSTYPSGLD